MSSDIEITAENSTNKKRQVWKHFTRGDEKAKGKYEATCNYCDKSWDCGELCQLEAHLANHCSSVPTEIVLKAFAICGIPWRIIESPFFIEALKETNPSYEPPTRDLFSGRIFEQQLAKVNQKINEILQQQNNLTLALDGWSSEKNYSYWNFIIMIPKRHEYLYQLCDFSKESHTGDFLAEKIKIILEEIGPNRFSAIVTDNGANVRLARSKIRELIKEKNILGGGFKSYCKTRWTTACDCIESILRLEQVLKEMTYNYQQLLINDPVLTLESRNTTLGDCFVSLAKTAATIKKLPLHQNIQFRSYCIETLNNRFNEFDDNLYLLCYFLMPNFRGSGLKNRQFTRINTIEPEPDYLQELALKVLAIVSNSASCERNFSLLSWLTNNKRIQLDVQNLESIAKIYSFFNTNAKKGLPYFSAKMTEEQVLQVLNELNGQILEEEIIDQEELLQYIDRSSSNTRSANLNNKKLNLESSLNLDSEIFNNNIDYTIDNSDSSSEKSNEEIL
ncbi:hypothetical protein Glove_216g25 [Diversispora epigaea]|uniref:DUF659 domain-containing protein n=1 Tax=Diversispora epigaea TaxID=1348612 RepID=A0A397IM37_9GLOM|nr:hypothetical protein Glove_216g25 [Diversispora epigaea]